MNNRTGIIFDKFNSGCKKTATPCSCRNKNSTTGGIKPLPFKLFKGKIISGFDKQVLVGATILNKNSKVGVTTDFDGNFEVIGNSDDIVQVSFVGHKAISLPLANLPKIVTLQSDGMLDEIILTAKKPSVKAGLIVAGVALAFYGYAKHNESGVTTKTTKTIKKKVTG